MDLRMEVWVKASDQGYVEGQVTASWSLSTYFAILQPNRLAITTPLLVLNVILMP